MKYTVNIKKKVIKNLKRLPGSIQEQFKALTGDLINKGPIQKDWHNFSKIGKNKYHCHLTRSYVACWKNEKESIIIEVYYVGSREDAPY